VARTPDRTPGVEDQEGSVYSDEGVAATAEGEVRYTGGTFSMMDAVGTFNPREGAGGQEFLRSVLTRDGRVYCNRAGCVALKRTA